MSWLTSEKPSASEVVGASAAVNSKIQLTFKPGKLGVAYNFDTGVVSSVRPDTQAAKANVQPGWHIVKVDGQTYTKELLSDRANGTQDYNIVFVTPVADGVPSSTGTYIRVCGHCGAVLVALFAVLVAILMLPGTQLPGSEVASAKPASRRVLVVGAGASGLVTLKEMLEAGHDAFAVEVHPAIGGVWSRGSAQIYKDLYLTTSNFLMAFSDFPPADQSIKYSTADEYMTYLERYANAFDLLPRIRFNTEVVSARMNGAGAWEVTLKSGHGGEEDVTVDFVAVATGANREPMPCQYPGFSGETFHSSQVANATAFRGKKVLVVGTGESGSDMASDIADVAASTIVWSRRPPALAPRFPIRSNAPDELDILKGPNDGFELRVRDFLEKYSLGRAGYNIRSFEVLSTLRHFLWGEGSRTDAPDKYLGVWMQMYPEDTHIQAEFSMWVTNSIRLSQKQYAGKLDVIVSEDAVIRNSSVVFPSTVFAGGAAGKSRKTEFPIDTVVCATGYRSRFDWLKVDVDWNPRTWFKHAFPARYGDKLMFVGWARPHQGGIPAASELIARYGAMIASGERRLPADYADIALDEGKAETQHYRSSPNLTSLVDYPAFTNVMAELIGCQPQITSILNPSRLMQFLFYPEWPCWFRKDGTRANRAAVDAVLDKVPFEIEEYPVKGFEYMMHSLRINVLSCITAYFKGIDNTGLTEEPHWLYDRSRAYALHGRKMTLRRAFFLS